MDIYSLYGYAPEGVDVEASWRIMVPGVMLAAGHGTRQEICAVSWWLPRAGGGC